MWHTRNKSGHREHTCIIQRPFPPAATMKLPGCNGSNNSTHHQVTCVLREFQGAPLSGQPSSSSSSNSTVSPFMPSTSSPRSPIRRTCDGARDRKEHSTTSREEVHIHSGCCPDESGLRSVAGTRRSCLSSAARLGRVTL